jgi:hypothetical protein
MPRACIWAADRASPSNAQVSAPASTAAAQAAQGLGGGGVLGGREVVGDQHDAAGVEGRDGTHGVELVESERPGHVVQHQDVGPHGGHAPSPDDPLTRMAGDDFLGDGQRVGGHQPGLPMHTIALR